MTSSFISPWLGQGSIFCWNSGTCCQFRVYTSSLITCHINNSLCCLQFILLLPIVCASQSYNLEQCIPQYFIIIMYYFIMMGIVFRTSMNYLTCYGGCWFVVNGPKHRHTKKTLVEFTVQVNVDNASDGLLDSTKIVASFPMLNCPCLI